MLKKLWNGAKRLYKDERGADMVEYVLIFAAISLPIVAILFFYKDKIVGIVEEKWNSVFGSD